MKKTIYRKIMACLMLLISFQSMQAQLLKGTVKGGVKEMMLRYSFSGETVENVSTKVQLTPDGNFFFDMADMPVERLDVEIYINKDNRFGVHLQRGRTAVMHLLPDVNGMMQASFEGDNSELSRFYNAYVQASNVMMRNFSLDPYNEKPLDGYRVSFEDKFKEVRKLLPAIQDKTLYTYYTQLTNGTYDYQRMRFFISNEAKIAGKKPKDYPEYNEILNRVNPNNPVNIRTGLSLYWVMSHQNPKSASNGDLTDYFVEILTLTEKHITNSEVHRSICNYAGSSFFRYGYKKGDVDKFWASFQTVAQKHPDLIAIYQPKMDAIHNTQKGANVPYAPVLTRPDGTNCNMSDLYGKLIYMDIWATWCGPCCKEIPFMEKIAAHYKDNDGVYIISISTDQNQKPWLKKLETDKPEWPQYILSKEESQKFMKAWGINGIPRFILIDKDGKILNADAPRPSEESIIKLIDANL